MSDAYIVEQCQRYRQVFDTDNGQWVLNDLTEEFSERTSFDPTNQYRTAFLEGQRHVVLAIQTRLTQDLTPLIRQLTQEQESHE